MEGGVLLVLALSLLAADTQPERPDPPPAYSVERVKDGLERPAPTLAARDTDIPVFRVRIRGQRRYDLLWEDHAARAPYVHQNQPIYHFEYLRMNTPEAFRASTLYPGADVMPAVRFIKARIQRGIRSHEQARVRREIEAALREIQSRQRPTGG